ncbi:MAG TPA: T9SS type A sorting domain-containing protein, partial [Bacteroidia bacterium]|nr:T9SS type A sorting domain-containing protein [Bacteroidia bacterium]
GSASAYGSVYYSVNGGPWTQTGNTLNNRHKWQYTTITNPAFNNVEDLRFGFRWINKNASGHDTSALGIDDVSLYGTYDSINHPITCTFTNLNSDSCLGNSPYVFFSAALTDSTCGSTWDVYMSDKNGNFPGPFGWNQPISLANGNDLLSYWYLTIPNTYTTVGGCYKFKLERLTYPYLTFIDSFCFPFDTCPGNIITLQPAVTMDTNPVCAGSVIDVPFNSTGTYKSTNIYYAELIDSTGSTAKIDTIGQLLSSSSFPNYPAGSIPGEIPLTVPAGCKYYIRVVSSTPYRIPDIWGPFCIQHCDILSNSQQNLQACLGSCYKDPGGYTVPITYNTHEYDNRAIYASSNNFQVQVLSYTTFAAINTGKFGFNIDTTSGTFNIHIPCPDSLTNVYGMPPGVYYMRIVATNSSFSDSSLGSVVHLTIGEPADSLYLTLSPLSGPYCQGAIITFTANPDDEYTIGSTYNWWETDKKNGVQPFIGSTNYNLALLTSNVDTILITCQENSYGCLGPKVTIPDSIQIIGKPNVTKKGPAKICLGDTGTFSVPFANNTDYKWSVSGTSAHCDTANNILKVSYSSLGTFRISVVVINACFVDSAVWTVKSDTCNPLSVQNYFSNHSLSVYPNPSKGEYTFTFSGGNYSGSKLEIYNVLGEIVKSEEITNSSTLVDLGSNPNGIYYYRIIAGDGARINMGKLVLEK